MAVEDSPQPLPFLDTLEGEIAFFRSLMRARPVGVHRQFHALVICNAIQRDTGRWVPMEEIWEKLRTCYNLETLEHIEAHGYDVPGSSSPSNGQFSTSNPPSPSDNLAMHPYFKTEYTLPEDHSYEEIISKRRMRLSVSTASPAPSPSHHREPHEKEKERPVRTSKKRSKRQMAGLVGGDSDSSALTQESGDESVAPTPATGTDGATEYDGEYEQSPEASSTKGRKGQKGRRNSIAGKGKAPPPPRAIKKRKR